MIKKNRNYVLLVATLWGLALFGCKSTPSETTSSKPTVSVQTDSVPNSSRPAKATPASGKDIDTNASTSTTTSNKTAKAEPKAGKGNVQGTVLSEGKPVEGIEVELCEKFDISNNSSPAGHANRYGCSGKSYTASTDTSGVYMIANVEPGEYGALIVKYVYLGRNGASYRKGITVNANKTNFVMDTNLTYKLSKALDKVFHRSQATSTP